MITSSDPITTKSHHVSDKIKYDPAIRDVLNTAKPQHIPKGSHLLYESDHCQNFIWVLKGTIRVFKNSLEGREITLYRINPGETCLLCLQHLLSGDDFPAEAIAETDVTLLTLNQTEFHDAINNSEAFRYFLLNFFSQRIGKIMNLVSEVTFERLELRLACLLGQLFERSEEKPIAITHAQLARELGTSREVISRILKEFEYQKCIKLSRGKIDLISSEGLSLLNN